MSSSMVFLGKEFKELTRTAKAIILPIVFIFFGATGPLVAKLLPEMLPKMLKDSGLPNFTITTTAVDAWGQFLKSLNQMGFLAIILIFMGMVAEEHSKGTTLLVLTKPLSRGSFVMTKVIAGFTVLMVSIWGGYLACLYYTDVLFNKTLAGPAAGAVGLFSVYALLVLALTTFASTISKNTSVSGAISLGGLICLNLTSFEGLSISKWSPGALSGISNSILAGKAGWTDAWPPVLATVIIALTLIIVSVVVLNKKEL